MADERTITTIFRADISQFTASTQDLNRYVSQINSEFKNATASMTRWNDNATGLQAKLNQLNGVLDAETRKLNSMESAYAELVAQGKQNTREAQNLATAINNQSAKVKETQKNIDYYTNSLKQLDDAGVETTQELDAMNKKLDDQKQAAKDTGDALLHGAAVGIAGIGAAVVGAVGGLSRLVESTKESRIVMGQLETAFTDVGFASGVAEKTYTEFNSVLGDTTKTTETLQHLAAFSKTEQELTDYTHILTGVYAKFGHSIPTESLAEGINHTIQLGSVQGTLADALEWSGINVDDFNKQLATCNTEEERNALISSTLDGLYGDLADSYKETNKDLIANEKAQTEYNNAMNDIATKVQPIMTQFKLKMVEVLQTILKKFDDVDIAGLIGKIGNAITKVVDVALPPLMSAISWIIDNMNWLAPTLGTIVGLIGGISAAIKIYNGVMAVARTVQLAWNLALTMNPIGLVVIAIGGLVAAFVLLWNKCEGFRNFFINMWNSIKTIGKSVANYLSNTFGSIINTIKGVINGMISVVNGAIKSINKISVKVPDWVPKYGGKKFGFNLKTIPKLATGGIIDKPTMAMIGEAGKEAVMPLENNTGWIDKLADKLNAKQVAPSNVTNNYNVTNRFEKMETSKLAMHKSNLELKRMIGG